LQTPEVLVITAGMITRRRAGPLVQGLKRPESHSAITRHRRPPAERRWTQSFGQCCDHWICSS